jgi:hypothetical protein
MELIAKLNHESSSAELWSHAQRLVLDHSPPRYAE